jgi:hypothetical protein
MVLALGLLALAACTSVVSGSGSVDTNGGPSVTITIPSPTVPAPSGSSSGKAAASCPHVSYPAGRLAFDCISGGLAAVAGSTDPVWSLSLDQAVEPQWVLSEGARKLEPLGGRSLAGIAAGLRAAMLAANEYGDAPTMKTESAASATVAGVPAYVLRTAVTINPEYRAQNGLQVHVERLWIVVLNAGDGQVAAWYVSVPDDVSALWSKVPDVIASIGLI